MKMDSRVVLLTSVIIAILLLQIGQAYQLQATVIKFRLEYGDSHFIRHEGNLVDMGEYWYLNANKDETSQVFFGIPEKEGIEAFLVFTYSKDELESVGKDTLTLMASSGGGYDTIWSAPEWGPVVNETVYVYVPPEYFYFRFVLSDGRNSYEYLKLNKSMQVILFANQNQTPTTTEPIPSPPPPPPLFDITPYLNQDFFLALTLVAAVVTSYIAYRIIKRGKERKRGKGIKFEKYG